MFAIQPYPTNHALIASYRQIKAELKLEAASAAPPVTVKASPAWLRPRTTPRPAVSCQRREFRSFAERLAEWQYFPNTTDGEIVPLTPTRGRTKQPPSAAQIAEALQARSDGLSLTAIGDLVGLSSTTVGKLCRQHLGADSTKSKGRSLSAAQRKQIAELRASGASYQQISEQIGCSSTTVGRVLHTPINM